MNVVRMLQGSSEGWDRISEVWFDDETSMAAGFAAMAEALARDRSQFLAATAPPSSTSVSS